MFFCLRIDLDYVPWDTPDAEAYGHGEPAMLLRLLELARATGYRFHFFVSNRALHAFPTTAEAVLNEGHDLDWFCKHPSGPPERQQDAMRMFAAIGHRPRGLCVKTTWPPLEEATVDLTGFEFLSSAPGPVPPKIHHFPVETRSPREASRAGQSARVWADATRAVMRDTASRNIPTTVVLRPQVLAKFDPKLHYVREILDLASVIGLPVRTLRQVVDGRL